MNLFKNVCSTKILSFSVISLLFFVGVMGTITYAQDVPYDPDPDDSGVIEENRLANPLGNIDSIPKLIKQVLEIAITIAVPIIVILIIYAGFRLVQAQGNPSELEVAKKRLLYIIIGAALVLGAWVIATAIQGTVESIRDAAGVETS